MRLAIDVNTSEDVLWIDLHVFRRVFGFVWKKRDHHRAWFYSRRYPPPSEGTET